MRRPLRRFTMPLSPKSAHGWPVAASSATRRASIVRDEDAARGFSGLPGGNAAVREIAIAFVAGNFGIVGPDLIAGERIEGDDAAERSSDVELAVDVERRGFERGGASVLRLIRVAGAESPGDFERLDVLAVDGGERGKALAAGIVAIGRPFAV